MWVHGRREHVALPIVGACRRSVRGDGAAARGGCVCGTQSRVALHARVQEISPQMGVNSRACARPGVPVWVCPSRCARGFPGQGCAGAHQHQTPSWVLVREARSSWSCPGCAATAERGQLGAGVTGLAEPGGLGGHRAACGPWEPPCSAAPHRCRKLYWTDGDNISVANMDGSNRTLLFANQKGPVGTDPPRPQDHPSSRCPSWP